MNNRTILLIVAGVITFATIAIIATRCHPPVVHLTVADLEDINDAWDTYSACSYVVSHARMDFADRVGHSELRSVYFDNVQPAIIAESESELELIKVLVDKGVINNEVKGECHR